MSACMTKLAVMLKLVGATDKPDVTYPLFKVAVFV